MIAIDKLGVAGNLDGILTAFDVLGVQKHSLVGWVPPRMLHRRRNPLDNGRKCRHDVSPLPFPKSNSELFGRLRKEDVRPRRLPIRWKIGWHWTTRRPKVLPKVVDRTYV